MTNREIGVPGKDTHFSVAPAGILNHSGRDKHYHKPNYAICFNGILFRAELLDTEIT